MSRWTRFRDSVTSNPVATVLDPVKAVASGIEQNVTGTNVGSVLDPVVDIGQQLSGAQSAPSSPPPPPSPTPGGRSPGPWQEALVNALRSRGQYGVLNTPEEPTGVGWKAPTAIGRGGNPWRAPMALGGLPPTLAARDMYGPPTQITPPTPGDYGTLPTAGTYVPLVGPQRYMGPGRYMPPTPPPAPAPEPEPVQDPNITGGA